MRGQMLPAQFAERIVVPLGRFALNRLENSTPRAVFIPKGFYLVESAENLLLLAHAPFTASRCFGCIVVVLRPVFLFPRKLSQTVTNKSKSELAKTLREARKELEKAQERLKKIDAIFKKLYEDNADGKISNEQFAKMIASYETEQKELESHSAEIKAVIAQSNDSIEGANRFVSQVRKYTDVKELSAGLIREFVDRIYVSEKQVVNGRKVQKIRILWNCIGEFTPPTGFSN